MPVGDLIVAALWVGGLTLFLLGQAFVGWLKLRYARRSARHASQLSEATRDLSVRRSRGVRGELISGGSAPPTTRSQA